MFFNYNKSILPIKSGLSDELQSRRGWGDANAKTSPASPSLSVPLRPQPESSFPKSLTILPALWYILDKRKENESGASV